MALSRNPKGWKSPKYPGYVKSHNAVRVGVSRNPAKAEPTKLSEEQLAELGWKPALASDIELQTLRDDLKEYVDKLKNTSGGSVYVPPIVNANGTIENISQFKVEKEGPEAGHWATVNGKRKWIEGQHNYNRQQNPRSHEHINQTNVMNNNMKLEKLGSKNRDETTGKTYVVASNHFEEEARIVRYGRVVSVKKTTGCAVERAIERAMKRIEKGTANFLTPQSRSAQENNNLAPDNSIESQVQSGAGIAKSPVASEGHV